MNQIADINYEEIEKNEEYEELIKEITEQCFKEEKLDKTDLYLSITLSNEDYIHQINKETVTETKSGSVTNGWTI